MSATVTDTYGLPAPKIDYRLSENSAKLLGWHEDRARESWLEAGAAGTVTASRIRNTGWHMLGTTRMGTDRDDSVVDPEARSHDIPNLLVFDGSIWPTSSGLNPTATVVALALRNTERLIARRSNQETP
jgi:choline dehydrogenase-like flavoprotein